MGSETAGASLSYWVIASGLRIQLAPVYYQESRHSRVGGTLLALETNLVAPFQLEHGARLIRRRDLQAKLFEYAANLADLFGI